MYLNHILDRDMVVDLSYAAYDFLRYFHNDFKLLDKYAVDCISAMTDKRTSNKTIEVGHQY